MVMFAITQLTLVLGTDLFSAQFNVPKYLSPSKVQEVCLVKKIRKVLRPTYVFLGSSFCKLDKFFCLYDLNLFLSG